MSNSIRLALPFIDAAQSQKHVTHNEAIVALDALVHLAVNARDVAAPPASPSEGDRYLVPAGASGGFAGHVDAVAAFDDGGWAFLTPRAGWRAYVETEDVFLLFDGAAWKDLGLSLRELQDVSRLGVGATADAGNPLLAKINSALFTARATGEGGTGDLRIAMNKSVVGGTVSQLYQTNYSGRAETGLAGDDSFRIKVSADGAVWREALRIDPASGLVTLPHTAGVANGLATLDAAGKVTAAQLPTSAGQALRGYISGYRLSNNATASATKIDVSAGLAADSANSALISCAAMTINCAATGANGLDAGALAANAWYHAFVIAKSDGSAAYLASASAGAPALPSGYTAFRRIGSFRTDGAAAILAFAQIDDTFYFSASITDVATTNMGATNALYALSVPTGVRVRPIFDIGSWNANLLVFDGDDAGYPPGGGNISNAPGFLLVGAVYSVARVSDVYTDVAARIRVTATSASAVLYIYTRGWIDTRGRLA